MLQVFVQLFKKRPGRIDERKNNMKRKLFAEWLGTLFLLAAVDATVSFEWVLGGA